MAITSCWVPGQASFGLRINVTSNINMTLYNQCHTRLSIDTMSCTCNWFPLAATLANPGPVLRSRVASSAAAVGVGDKLNLRVALVGGYNVMTCFFSRMRMSPSLESIAPWVRAGTMIQPPISIESCPGCTGTRNSGALRLTSEASRPSAFQL